MTLGNALGQTAVNVQPAPAVAGDFASGNPRFNYLAGPGGLVAGALGLTIGAFAWVQPSPEDGNGAGAWANNFGSGPVAGFVHREQQGINPNYLQVYGMFIPAGFQVTLETNADLWVVNSGSTEAEPGQKAYANFQNGTASFAATASPSNAATSTASTIAAGTGSFTGSINGNILTITAVGSGVAVVGGQLSGTGVAANTAITQQLSGTTGGIGTYGLNVGDQNVASTTISETYGTLTVGGTLTGTFAVGSNISLGASAGTVITALGTGTGGAGTYIVNNTQTVSSTAINAGSNVETKWFATTPAQPGELVKISANPLG